MSNKNQEYVMQNSKYTMQAKVITILAVVMLFAFASSPFLAEPSYAQSKRPITIEDFDKFRSVSQQQLSNDGKWVSFRVKPRKGDSELTILNLTTNDEYTIPRSSGPSFSDDSQWITYTILPHEKTAEEEKAEEEARKKDEDWKEPPKEPNVLVIMNLNTNVKFSITRGTRPTFTDDSQLVAYTIEPEEISEEVKSKEEAFTKAETAVRGIKLPEVEQEQKALEEAIKNAKESMEKPPKETNKLEVINLQTGEKFLVDRIDNFKFSDDSKWLAYKLLKPEEPEEEKTEEEVEEEPTQRRGRGPRETTGAEMVLRELSTKAEERFQAVDQYFFTDESEMMYFTVSSEQDENDGIYFKDLSRTNAPAAPIITGKGKYQNIAWNEDKDKMLFLSDCDDQEAKNPTLKLYSWKMKDEAAQLVYDPLKDVQFPEDMQIASSGASWSKDNRSIFFNITELPEEDEEKEDEEEKKESPVIVWHWKDVVIKSQEQARLTGKTTGSSHVSGGGRRTEDAVTYRAVYHLSDGKFIQLTDENMSSLNNGPNDRFGIGSDSKKYEEERPWSPTFRDYYFVNLRDGTRTPLEMRTRWSYQWSDDGQFLLQYVQPHWWVYDIKTGAKRNLTEKLNVAFWNTDDDHPNVKRAWGTTGWTKDDEGVLLNDKYDIWYFPIKTEGEPVNVTAGLGRKIDARFRYYRMDQMERTGRTGQMGRTGPEEEYIDLDKTMRLSYFNNKTKATGYYKVNFGSEPVKIVAVDKRMSSPRKAKDADFYMFTLSTSYEYGDIYVSDIEFNNMRKISDAMPNNLGFLLGKAQLIDYTNLNGVPLQAILTLPENYVEGKKYPMIIYFYEKLTQGLHSYSTPSTGSGFSVTYFVSNGYVVLQPDIIYTDGFPGPSAVKCVVPAAQKVIDMGIADPKAIAITGHSWGGYQTAYIVTQTDMFACAYAGAPVSNMSSAYGGIRWGTGNPRTFQYETGQSRIGGTLWEYPERYIENSPLFFADRVNTPIMLLHGDEDTAVPWYQSIEYFMALRRLDKPVWFLQYLEEPHGLRDEAARKDFTIRRDQFFAHYLKGEPMPKWMKEGLTVGEGAIIK